jgi:hypothetical protein
MRTIWKILIFLSFLSFSSILPVWTSAQVQSPPSPQAVGEPAPPLAASPSVPRLAQMEPWYKDPTLAALIGVFGTTFAAFLTAIIALRVRKLTNRHELRKMTLEKQLTVYEDFFAKIVQIDLIDSKDDPSNLVRALIDLVAQFERSYPYLDKQTIKVFNEQIAIPIEGEMFTNMLYEKGYEATYKEVRYRLMGKVLPTAKAFLDQFK